MSQDYTVKPVYKALQVLHSLAEEQREMSLKEICGKVGLPKTTVFRYLFTLRSFGWVAHDEDTDLYRLGTRVWEFGQLAAQLLYVREAALPHMRELRNRFNETVNLAMIEGTDIVYLDMAESRRSLRMQARLGSHDPVYTTALGKAMLAFMAEDQWPNHLPTVLAPRTPKTIVSLAALRDVLIQIRRLGFSVDHGENEAGASCLAAPILDHRGQVVAALSVSAPTSRLNDRIEAEVASAVTHVTDTISKAIGYRSAAEANRVLT